ncbi:MAG: phosphatase PAP2 family protein [Candidatus Bipolaricaulota bacterium]
MNMENSDKARILEPLIRRLDKFSLWLVARDELGLERISESPLLKRFSRYLIAATYFGDGYLWGLAGLALILFGGGRGHTYVLIGLAISIVNIAVFRLVKTVMERPRPVTLRAKPMRHRMIDDFAFPSGHATIAFGVSFIIATAYPGLWWAWMFAYISAIVISLSRIFVKEHYPSDVIGGAILGTLVAGILLPVFRSLLF